MDIHPAPFTGNKAQSVKSKYKKISEAPKQKIKEAHLQSHRRTFGTVRNPNVPAKTVPENPKAKVSNHISLKQPKTESAKKSPVNSSNNRTKPTKKKSVSFSENFEASEPKNSPAREVDEVKTPVRPPFSAKPIRTSGTPYLSAEKCSSCRLDRLETASYWLGQIKSAESVGKHFVSAVFFRLAYDCNAKPARNLRTELKKYLACHDDLTDDTEWKDLCRRYGTSKKGHEDDTNLFPNEEFTRDNPRPRDAHGGQEQRTGHET